MTARHAKTAKASNFLNPLWLIMIGGLLVLIGCAGSGPVYNQPATGGNVPQDTIRTGDALIIRVLGTGVGEERVFETTVSPSGNISLEYIQPVRAQGLTGAQLEAAIRDAYVSNRIYAHPTISVVQATRFITVSGEVRSNARVPYTPNMTAMEAIAAAGGFTEFADRRRIPIIRGSEKIFFNGQSAKRNSSSDPPLKAGDRIYVPRTPF